MNQSIHRLIYTFIGIFGNLPILYLCINNYEFSVLADFSKGILIFQYFFLINEWGFNLYALEKINFQAKKVDKKIINEIIFSKILIGIFNLVFLALLLILDVISFSNVYMPLLLMFIIFSSAFNPLWFFQAIGKIELLNFPLFTLKLSQLIILFYFISTSNLYLFFITQGILLSALFLYNLYILNKLFDFRFKLKFSHFLLGFNGVIKLQNYFLSNLHNHINLTMWGVILIILGSPLQIIIFNIIDTIYRGMNAIFQALIEPIFRVIKLKLKNLTFLFLFAVLLLLLTYYYIPFLTHLIFPNYSNDLIEIFRLLSILLAILFTSKVTTYFFLGGNSIVKMNRFNIYFLLIEILFVFYWYYFMQINVKEIILLLLLLNFGKVILITLLKLFPKLMIFIRLND
tara:strand:+ start:144 stop:1346 length:1203 start_codon:yes stop_codon:yes gene_type:complete